MKTTASLITSLLTALVLLITTPAFGDQPDPAVLKAGIVKLKALNHIPLGLHSQGDKPGTLEIEPGGMAKAEGCKVTIVDSAAGGWAATAKIGGGTAIEFGQGEKYLAGTPRFSLPDNVAFVNIGAGVSILAGSIELKKGECATVKDGKIVKLALKIQP